MAVKETSKKRKSSEAPVKDVAPTTKKVKTTVNGQANGTTAIAKTKVKSETKKKPTTSTTIAITQKDDPVEADFAGFGSDESQEGEEEDQAAALLAGFGSDDDEDQDATANDTSVTSTKPVPSLPQSQDLQEKLAKGAEASVEPGVIYVGRLPHGFYEHQMTGYFSQFGEISKLRMAHNRRTGSSKHYAFIEFSSDEVAKIVADTMDNYLMFSHILKVKYIPKEKVHPKLWEGAGKRFRKIPWNRIEKNRLEKADRKSWEKRSTREQAKREKKSKALKELGYEFEAPALRSVDDVPVSVVSVAAVEEPVQAVDAVKQIASTAANETTLDSVINPDAADNVIAKEVKRRKESGKRDAGSGKVIVKAGKKKAIGT